eukprot:gene11490-biopygen7861
MVCIFRKAACFVPILPVPRTAASSAGVGDSGGPRVRAVVARLQRPGGRCSTAPLLIWYKSALQVLFGGWRGLPPRGGGDRLRLTHGWGTNSSTAGTSPHSRTGATFHKSRTGRSLK